ncbi:glycoside hydrolase family 15 protein [Roseicella aerolata]|uniref:Trehalase n=1 Tax=Roseicella aerolata TaxID=2883479 RepID=A0A9X1IIB0_9PROT|nr:glycoside hydrolase family 15 protein [Roseicella aerolata]
MPPSSTHPVAETLRIEDYALIGDTFTAALVGRNGSIDWLCAPRFDSGACFAALLGRPENGRWQIAPAAEIRSVTRRYRDGTLILDTEFETDTGAVVVTDFMPLPSTEEEVDVVRIVHGLRGEVPMQMEVLFRFDYGHAIPWLRRRPYGVQAIAGPDALQLWSPVALSNHDFTTTAEFTVREGQRIPFSLCWYKSHRPEPPIQHPDVLLECTARWWRDWSAKCTYDGRWSEAVRRSLATLKALTYSPTGGIVAAPTTSLPEEIGGVRNWDYRYCWIRDATLTLYSLVTSGYTEEAVAWRRWLLRSAAGRPEEMQIMYGIAGERRLPEMELPWLAGYEGSRPVRIGNLAQEQFQLDIYGELMDALHVARKSHVEPDAEAWRIQKVLMRFIGARWGEPDNGIWEVRGPRRHFTHSKLMAWVGVDRAIADVEQFGFEGPVAEWRALRARIHDDICRNGYSEKRKSFVQYYGGEELDAALLIMPMVGFLPPTDPRITGTVAAIGRDLTVDGFVWRYRPETGVDGLVGGEGAFLPCTFWLADALALIGRQDEAVETFERLLAIRNDVGLLAEEYDPRNRRQLGNFPQAFSHIGLINTAQNLTRAMGPAQCRATDTKPGAP